MTILLIACFTVVSRRGKRYGIALSLKTTLTAVSYQFRELTVWLNP